MWFTFGFGLGLHGKAQPGESFALSLEFCTQRARIDKIAAKILKLD